MNMAHVGTEYAGFAAEYGENDGLFRRGSWYKDERCWNCDAPTKGLRGLRGLSLRGLSLIPSSQNSFRV